MKTKRVAIPHLITEEDKPVVEMLLTALVIAEKELTEAYHEVQKRKAILVAHRERHKALQAAVDVLKAYNDTHQESVTCSI